MLEIAIFVNLRSVHSAPLPRPQLTVPARSGSLEAARQGRRPAYFDEYQAYRGTPIYQRDLLSLGVEFDGDHRATRYHHGGLSRRYLSGRRRRKSPPYPSHLLRHYGH